MISHPGDRRGELIDRRTVRRERIHDLPARVRHTVERIARVDPRNVNRNRSALAAADRQLLGASDPALDRVSLDDDVGDVGQHLLLIANSRTKHPC